jgi:hypothetical protein
MDSAPTRRLFATLVMGCALLPAAAGAAIRELDWFELMPPWDDAEPEAPADLSSDQPFMMTFDPVPDLDGLVVRLPGYVVPLDSDEGGLLDEFLLVPFFGACIHVPPPPPNQLVYVRLARPFYLRSMEDPYWVTGVLHVRPWESDFAEALYMMDGQAMELFR